MWLVRGWLESQEGLKPIVRYPPLRRDFIDTRISRRVETRRFVQTTSPTRRGALESQEGLKHMQRVRGGKRGKWLLESQEGLKLSTVCTTATGKPVALVLESQEGLKLTWLKYSWHLTAHVQLESQEGLKLCSHGLPDAAASSSSLESQEGLKQQC